MTRNNLARLVIEALEQRELPAVVIPLTPARDQFGDQVVTLQRYQIDPQFYNYDGYLNQFAIFDTGSPFISFGYYASQQNSGDGDLVPIKVPGGAIANAIGGRIAADVGMPGLTEVQGIGGLQFTFGDEEGYPSFPPTYHATWAADLPQQLVQPVVTPLANGDYRPEYELPTLSGMPVLAPSSRYALGRAALIDFTGTTVDFTTIQLRDDDGDGVADYGDEAPWIIQLPDIQFITPGSSLVSDTNEAPVIQIPLTMVGSTNTADPGIDVTRTQVPVQTNVALVHGTNSLTNKTMLFDTGSQLTTITMAMANALGLDLNNPEMTTTIIGAAGRVENVPGFVLDSLTLPTIGSDTLQFTNVPVYVIDVPGYDGVMGTNLFGPASRMLFDPFADGGARLSVAFFNNRPDAPAPISSNFYYTLQQAGLLALLDDPSGFPLPGANFQTGQISGQVYHDVNRDRQFTTSDTPLYSATVFVDLNKNGSRDFNEPFTTSGATGVFSISGLTPGRTYTIRQEGYPDLLNLEPARTVRVRSDRAVTDLLFRNTTPPPKVLDVHVGQGLDRSSIRELTITFDRVVSLATDAIFINREGGRNPVINWTANSDFGRTVVTITFPGQDIRGGSLADGKYQLRIRSNRVLAEDGQSLDGNANGLAGDDFKYSFHRLFGDMNGDGRLNQLDQQILHDALLQPDNQQYSGLDYNGNGIIDSSDVAKFRFNYAFNHILPGWLFRSRL